MEDNNEEIINDIAEEKSKELVLHKGKKVHIKVVLK